jgi:hypothetical protein
MGVDRMTIVFLRASRTDCGKYMRPFMLTSNCSKISVGDECRKDKSESILFQISTHF